MSAQILPSVLTRPELIAAYLAAGFKLIPIPAGQKSPRHKGWQRPENCIVPANWTENLGLALAYSRLMTLDIDAYNQAYFWGQERAIDLQAMLTDPNNVQISSGRPDHYKLVFKLPAWTGPIARKQVSIDGQAIIDFRCATKAGHTVQDIIPDSIHPDTGQPYQWIGDWRNIPEIPDALLQVWMELLAEQKSRAVHQGPVPEEDELRSALFTLDPDMDRGSWVKVGMALHSADSTLEWLFDEWSAGGSKYVGDDITPVWESFDVTEGGITVGTLFRMALDLGWKSPGPSVQEILGLPSVADQVPKSLGSAAVVEVAPTDVEFPEAPVPDNVFLLPSSHTLYTTAAANIFKQIAPTHTLFVHGAVLSELVKNQGQYILKPLDADEFCTRLDGYGKPVCSYVVTNDGVRAVKPKRCPRETAAKLIKSKETTLLPSIRAVTSSPIIVEQDGEAVVLNKGYHSIDGGILVARGKSVPEVQIEEAAAALKDLFTDFQFQSPSDDSRALAMLITPALKIGSFIEDPCPVDVAEADKSQAGKGYRQEAVRLVYGESAHIVTKRTGGVGSLDESLSSAIMGGRPFVMIDNIRGPLNSQFMESAITSPQKVSVRVPGVKSVEVDARAVTFQMTSNGMETTRDMANRSCIVRIRKQPQGYPWRVWPEGGLLAHITKNQTYYLGCVFSIVKAWVAEGKPTLPSDSHDMHRWAGILDWIVQNLFQAAPLLDGHLAHQRRVSEPHLTWLRSVCLAAKEVGQLGAPLQANQIATLCEEEGIDWPRGARPRDECAANQLVGRTMVKIFRDEGGDTITIDGFLVTRITEVIHDAVSRHDRMRKTYLLELEEATPECLR